jgi:1-acyl-sn-glycerol-3-phosphate acyltransferase
MALLGIRFNIFSIILSTFIFGLGDDYSIFIMDGLLQKFRTGKDILNSFKTAVLLSALTTLIGVGVLIFAKHPALRSIAVTAIIGMVSVVLVSYTVSPAIFRWMTIIRDKPRTFPVTLGGILYAFVFYSYFIGGCIFTVLNGWTVIRILPVNKKKRKLAYHYMLYLVCKTTIYIMFMVKKRFINFNRETFRKPCLVVCNHQSLIDIPLALMWTPKMIMITNEKVYYSPLIGKLVQLGGFFPSSGGYEGISDRLKELIADGYSIFVFPEGTRAEDRKVKRFHKGAFYLAEQLNIDILPMVMHGTGEYIKKGEYFGRRSAITVKFLDRIRPDDLSWGSNYSERTKSIQKAFKREFCTIVEEYYSSVDYHKDLLFRNFIYKGPVLEWYMRVKVRLEDNYRFFNDLLPKKGRITDIGCGYGFLSYMLAMVSPERMVTGIDYDDDKIDVASHGISRPSNAQFFCGDVLEMPFQPSHAFVIADVLHYMPEEFQTRVIRKCADQLEPGGMIIIRDADTGLQKKHRGTAITEFFSTKVLGFNKTRQNKQLYFTSRETVYDALKDKGFSIEVVDETKYTSNIYYIIRNK